MKSVKLQLLVTLAATAVAAGVFIHRGPPPSMDLTVAVRDGIADQVKRNIRWGAEGNVETDVEALMWEGTTALHRAAEQGWADIAAYLIEGGADCNTSSGHWLDSYPKGTPLYFAAANGHLDVAKLLVDRGADIEGAGYGEPLRAAVVNGHADVVKLLVACGADVNTRSKVGNAPLDMAIETDNKEIADLLRQHGAKTGQELDELERAKATD